MHPILISLSFLSKSRPRVANIELLIHNSDAMHKASVALGPVATQSLPDRGVTPYPAILGYGQID
jgi:hypothetical protein